jgi:hypothetical protein
MKKWSPRRSMAVILLTCGAFWTALIIAKVDGVI